MLGKNRWAAAFFFVLFGGVLLTFSPASAQSGSTSMPLSNEQLAKFTDVYVAVTRIRRQYEPVWRAAQGAERNQLADRANRELQNVLDEHGLTAPEYNQLFDTVSRNDNLRQRALTMIRKKRGEA